MIKEWFMEATEQISFLEYALAVLNMLEVVSCAVNIYSECLDISVNMNENEITFK